MTKFVDSAETSNLHSSVNRENQLSDNGENDHFNPRSWRTLEGVLLNQLINEEYGSNIVFDADSRRVVWTKRLYW